MWRPLQVLRDGKAEVGVGWDSFEYGVVKLIEEVGSVPDTKYVGLTGVKPHSPSVCPFLKVC